MEIGKQKNGEVKSPLQAKGEQRRAGLKPGPYRRAFGAKCLEVFHAGVAQNRDDRGARSQLFADAQSGDEVGAGGNSGDGTLIRHAAEEIVQHPSDYYTQGKAAPCEDSRKRGEISRGARNDGAAKSAASAGGFGGFFLLGLFLLFFFLVLVADDFEDGYFGVVAHAIAGADDAGVAAGAVAKFWRDFAEEFLRDGRHQEIGSRLAARLQRVALAESDHFFGHGASGLGARERGGDAAVLEQIRDQAAQDGAAMVGLLAEFRSRVEMSHGQSLS